MANDPSDTIVLTYREEGGIDRRRLSGVLGASTTLLFLLLIVALSLGAIGAAGVGIGGFVVEFSDVTAPSGTVYPALAEQSNCEAAPQLTATLSGEAVIQDHFRVTKGIPVPGDTIDGVSVNIMSEAGNNTNITAEDLELRLVDLETDTIVLENTTISEYRMEPPDDGNPTPSQSYADASDPNSTDFDEVDTEFGVDAAGGFGPRNGRAVVYHIAFGNIDISDIGVTASLTDSENMSLAGSASNDCRRIYQMRNSPGGVPNSTNPGTPDSVTAGEKLEGDAQMRVINVMPSDDSLEVGETLTVEANITNVGDATGTWTAYMDVRNGTGYETVDTRNVSVPVNGTVNVTLEHDVRERELPNLDATFGVDEPEIVFADEPEEKTDAEPEAEPEIQVVDTRPGPDEPLEVGDTFAVDLNVTNVGNATGDWRVYMNVTDDTGVNATLASENVTVEPGESVAVPFEYEATSDDVPTVDATLGVDDLD